jgi:hypothetical protein
MRVAVAACLMAALVAGCHDNVKTYSRSDVVRAFRSQGFDLGRPDPGVLTVAPTPELMDATSSRPPPTLWIPKRQVQPLVVLLFKDDSDAHDAIQALRRAGYRDEFDVQKGNVVVTNDEGPRLIPSTEKRIRNALAQLDQ